MLENLTVDQLKEKAKSLGIAGASGMKKAELITAISAVEKQPSDSHSEGESQMEETRKFDKFKKGV